ncbi:MAG: hypothetical protein WAV76_02015 [Bacteroidota bacterium]
MKTLIYALIVICLLSCKRVTTDNKKISIGNTSSISFRIADSTASYYLIDSLFAQSLEIKYYKNDTIIFKFDQMNNNNDSSISISGIAVYESNQYDSFEVEGDRSEKCFDSRQYVNLDLDSGCLLYLQIELYKRDRFNIEFGNCGAINRGMLRKK